MSDHLHDLRIDLPRKHPLDDLDGIGGSLPLPLDELGLDA